MNFSLDFFLKIIRKMQILFKFLKLYYEYSNSNFNNNIITSRQYNKIVPKKIINKKISFNKFYWSKVALEILKSINLYNGKFFFKNQYVINHLASDSTFLANIIINKVLQHPKSQELLDKCKSSSFGSPFVLKKYPYTSTVTLSHIANLLSIYSLLRKNINQYKLFIDFGGGFGGLTSCLLQFSNKAKVYIVDLPTMHKVQKKFLIRTTNFIDKVFFYKNVSELKKIKYCIFNASFSFSEIPIKDRVIVEDFIIKNCEKIHIIFHDNFNEIDNNIYMREFLKKLNATGWKAKIKVYDYFANKETKVLYGSCN